MALDVGMVTIDCEDPGRLAEFWSQALDMAVLGDSGDFLVLGRDSSAVNIGLQKVPEPRVGKNRLHIDLSGEPRVAAAERLQALGATVKEEHNTPGVAWIVLSDPEGNEFCIGEYAS